MSLENDFDKHWGGSTYEAPSEQKIKIAEEFLRPVIKRINGLTEPPTILDAGCGDGVHAIALSRNVTVDFAYFGLDISQVAIESCQRRLFKDDRFHFYVADIEVVTLDKLFDVIISYGVIAYTSNPSNAVKNMSNHLRQDGIFVSWVYVPNCFEKIALKMVRRFAKIIGSGGTDKFASLLVYLMKILPISSGVNLSNSTFEQCKETILVNISPKWLVLPSQREVNKWYYEAGLTKLDKNTKGTIYVKPS